MKNKYAVIVLLVVAWAFTAAAEEARPNTGVEWVARANAQYGAGDFAASADSYGEAIALGASHPTTFYNGACSSALAGRVEEAYERLRRSIELGFRDIDLLKRDTDLDALRDDERWAPTVLSCEEAIAAFVASLDHPKVRDELLEMRRIDQAARRGEPLPELDEYDDMMDVDAVNTKRMKEIVSEIGWPTYDMVGEDGGRAAWLLVQHADADPEFQKRCLDLMTALPPDQVSATDIAYLTDRVRVNHGEEQLYGTQFQLVDGEWVPKPIEDEANVDARRASVGLGPIAEYAKLIGGG